MKILLHLVKVGSFLPNGDVPEQVWGEEYVASWFSKALRKKGFEVDIKQIGTVRGEYDIVIDFHPQAISHAIKCKKRFFWHQGDLWGHSVDSLTNYDLVFTASRVALVEWENRVKIRELLFGVDLEDRHPVNVKKEYDVLFLGNKLVRSDSDYIRYLLPLVKAGLKIKIYGNSWGDDKRYSKYWGGRLNMNKMCEEISKSKIRLCINSQYHRDWDLMVSRELETMACGTVVLGDRLPTNERLFEDCILFTDGFNDVVEKANMILEGKLAMDLIAKGFEKVKEHTWDKRVESIMDVLKI
jgi:hypothetical protein